MSSSTELVGRSALTRDRAGMTEAQEFTHQGAQARRIPWHTVSLAFCAADAIVAIAAVPLAFGLVDGGSMDSLDTAAFSLIALAPVLTVGSLYERSLYARSAVLQPVHLRRLAVAWLQACGGFVVAALILSVLFPAKAPSLGLGAALAGKAGGLRLSMVLAGGMAGLLAPRLAWSATRGRLFGRSFVHSRALVIGTGVTARQVIARANSDPSAEFEVIGILADDDDSGHDEPIGDVAVLGNTGDLAKVVRERNVDTVIVAMPWAAQTGISAIIALASRLPIEVRLAPDQAAAPFFRHLPNLGSGQHLVVLRQKPISGARAVLKRAEDIAFASLLLLALAPVMIVIAVAIKLDSRGPVLFRQPRYGFNNRIFGLCKFRSMYANMADEAAARQTSRADPRVTRVGAFLRRHSLDELPQLLNVLRGDMSVVGPRPHALGTRTKGMLLEEANAAYIARCQVKPGITGWAQVNGWRGELDTLEKLARRVEHDIDYIENWSLLLDIRILARTFGCVLRDADAF